MLNLDRQSERQFLGELLAASRAGRVTWTGSVLPGCHQFVAGEYVVAVTDENGEPVVALHHASGHRLETLRPGQFADPEGGENLAPLFKELVELARVQALGLRRRWRQLSRQIAPQPLAAKPAAEASA